VVPAANVYMARHGQTAYNLERRFQGQLPVPLDETGRKQAAELAERAHEHGFSALWCSTLQRARETVEIVSERLGMEVSYDARLAETDAGDWTDMLFSEVQAQAPELFAKFLAGDPSFAFPGGESFAQQEQRVAAALQDVEAGALPALVICHGMVIRAALSTRAGQWQAHAERVPNGALVALDPAQAPSAALDGDAATQPS
jgi:broad specificity phosphatase PhoE